MAVLQPCAPPPEKVGDRSLDPGVRCSGDDKRVTDGTSTKMVILGCSTCPSACSLASQGNLYGLWVCSVLPFSYLWSSVFSHTTIPLPPVRCCHLSRCCLYLFTASCAIVCYLQQFLMSCPVVSLVLLS